MRLSRIPIETILNKLGQNFHNENCWVGVGLKLDYGWVYGPVYPVPRISGVLFEILDLQA